MPASYATVTSLTARNKNMDTNCTWLTSPALFDDLCTKITAVGLLDKTEINAQEFWTENLTAVGDTHIHTHTRRGRT
jgi:hypothetical protein